MDKSETAFRTIGELSAELGVPQHILRYWESRFSQLRPLQRAGNRRYYRPEDVALTQRIDRLLNHEGYTIKGVQKLLAQRGGMKADEQAPTAPVPAPPVRDATTLAEVRVIRELLAEALSADR